MQSSRTVDSFGNTALHQAILSNQTDQALALIKSQPSLINELAQGNTPLLLAIKLGNIAVALALLENSNIRVNIADNLGMRAIHWAAFLRMDTVIQKLAEQSAPTLDEDKKALSLFNEIFTSLLPSDFYKAPMVDIKNLDMENSSFIEGRGQILTKKLLIHAALTMFSKRTQMKEKMREDVPTLAFTNLIYHLDSLCINYCGMKRKSFMRSYSEVEDDKTNEYKQSHLRTEDVFKHNFKTGYMTLVSQRNNIPLNEETLAALTRMESDIVAYRMAI